MPLCINPVDTLNRSINPPRSCRNGLAQRDYAQMDNPWRRARSRSASPAPANRRPDRERSPVPSTSQETITPSDSASNISCRIPDIIQKTWVKQPRTGARTKWSPIYEHYESITLVGEVYYKREDKEKKTAYEDVLRICTHCQEEGKTTQSTDSSRFGSTSNLWAHLKTSQTDEINDWLESSPIQEPVPDNMAAEQDIQWLMAWWRTNRFKYPRMAKIARRFLSVPASEVGVECCSLGDVIS
jgi:hypothetical protein